LAAKLTKSIVRNKKGNSVTTYLPLDCPLRLFLLLVRLLVRPGM